jgi:hypothetical protein
MSDDAQNRADLENEDWIKTTGWDYPKTWDYFYDYLGLSFETPEYRLSAIKYFMHLPMWKAAPQDIRNGAAQLLANGGK